MQRLTTLFTLFFTLSAWVCAQDITITLPPDISTCQDEVVSIGPIEVTGGDGNYTYNWTPGDHLSSTTELNPAYTANDVGVFMLTLTVQDGSGQQSMESLTITVDAVPVLEVIVQQPSCGFVGGGIITVNADIPETIFLWSDGTTGPSLFNLQAGTYCVTATSPFGCSTSDCYIVDQLDTPILTVEGLPTTYCETVEQITFNVSGGIPGYTYSTSLNGIVISTSAILPNPVDGFYQTTVTDANNCFDFKEYEINMGLNAEIAGTPFLNCSTGTTTLSIGNSTTGSNIVYTWTTPSGIIADLTSIVVDETGVYSLEVSDPTIAACSTIRDIVVSDANVEIDNWITTIVQDCNQYFLQGITIPDYFGVILYNWTFPDGSTSQNLGIEATQSGVYILETDIVGLGCTNVSTVFVDVDGGCGTLEGTVRLDNSGNCEPEENEIGVPNIVLTATDGLQTFNAITDDLGQYSFYLPDGDYTITHSLPSSNWNTCQDTYAATIPTGGTTALNIALQAEGDCPELSVGLIAPFLRRCFDNFYYLSVCNNGPETAQFPEVTVTLDDFLLFESATVTPTSIDGQTLVFNLNSLAPGACTQFVIRFLVSCDAEQGQTHCTEVVATPDPLCALGGGDWTGANLEIIADCVDGETVFTIQNTGSGDLTEPVGLIVIEDGIAMMNGTQEIPALPMNETEVLTFPANGSTYTIIVDQAPGHPYTSSVSSSIEGCGFNDEGGFSIGFITQYSQTTATPASLVYCLENIGSYDPNDKAALPKGYGPQQYIEPETEINYRIRFQNTGTDTAFTVVVRDTLSELLDVRSLKPGISSHNYELTISGERILTFTFNNILLPDSTANEPASNGFVNFSISPKIDAPLESVIENQAAIYFDFNESVLTNTVFHTLGRDFVLTNWTTIPDIELAWKAYPNPVSDRVQLELIGNIPTGNKTVRISDAQGRLLGSYLMTDTRLEIDLSTWPSGWYQMQLLGPQGQYLGQGRIVKGE